MLRSVHIPGAMADDKAKRKALQKALQAEAARALELWGRDAKVSKAKKGSPNFPFPIYIQRVVNQPEDASAFDIGELTVRLYVNGLDLATSPVSVKVTDKLPSVMIAAIQQRILAEWVAALQSDPTRWHVEEVLRWVEESFRMLCGLVDKCLDPYMGVTADGATQRRFAVIEPRDVEERKLTQAEKAAKAEEEERKAEEARAYWAKRREERAGKEMERAEAEGERKRALAEKGLLESGPAKLSKKQQQAMLEEKRAKKGRRTAKTGPRRRKFVPDEA